MRLVVQRVLECSVSVNKQELSRTGKGMLILLGITKDDTLETVKKYAQKSLKLRIWNEIPKKDTSNKTENSPQDPQIKQTEEKEEEKEVIKEPKTWDSNVVDNDYDIMVVSQFTLYGILKGNKPDFHLALNPKEALVLYESFVNELKKMYKPEKIQTGRFGEYMAVDYVNDGPVTLIIDSKEDK